MGERLTAQEPPREGHRTPCPIHGDAAICGCRPPRQTGDPVPSRPRTELRRVTVCEHDERLEVKSVRGIGFGARCTCGWRGQIRRTRLTALDDKHEHERTHAAP